MAAATAADKFDPAAAPRLIWNISKGDDRADDWVCTNVVGTSDHLERMDFGGSHRRYTSDLPERIEEHHPPVPDQDTGQVLDRRRVHSSEEAVGDHPC